MVRPKKTPPASTTTSSPAISKSNHPPSGRKGNDRTPLTRETIAADNDAFRKAGGKIEVLGVTHSLQRIHPESGTSPPAPAKPTSSRHN